MTHPIIEAQEHDAAIAAIMAPGIASLPTSDAHGGLIRREAERTDHAAHRLLLAVAEMLLPIVQRLDKLERDLADLHRDTIG